MKNPLSKILLSVILLVLFSMNTTSVMAEGTPTIEVGSAYAGIGERIEIPISFTNNPGISALALSITYDKAELSLESVHFNEDFGGNFCFAKKAAWFAGNNVDKDGIFMTACFIVNSDAVIGETSVSVVYSSGDICNYDEQEVEFRVIPGTVTIDVENTTTTSDNSAETEKISSFSENIITTIGRQEAKKVIEQAIKNHGVSDISQITIDLIPEFVCEVLREFDIPESNYDTNEKQISMFDEICDIYNEVSSTEIGNANEIVSDKSKNEQNGNQWIYIAISLTFVAVIIVIAFIYYNKIKNKGVMIGK